MRHLLCTAATLNWRFFPLSPCSHGLSVKILLAGMPDGDDLAPCRRVTPCRKHVAASTDPGVVDAIHLAFVVSLFICCCLLCLLHIYICVVWGGVGFIKYTDSIQYILYAILYYHIIIYIIIIYKYTLYNDNV